MGMWNLRTDRARAKREVWRAPADAVNGALQKKTGRLVAARAMNTDCYIPAYHS